MLISVVLSVYNEEHNLTEFWDKLRNVLTELARLNFELLWVDDGSTDKSTFILKNKIFKDRPKNVKHKLIVFTKNFGHEAAMQAGINYSTGDAIICMDTDMQNPPQLLTDMINRYSQGFEIVLMVKKENLGQRGFKKSASRIFYSILNSLSEEITFTKGASDFFLISKHVKLILEQEINYSIKFLRGIIQSLGFETAIIYYSAPKRYAGESKYSLKKLLELSLDAIFSFSYKPLRLSRLIALFYIFFSIVLSGYSVYQYFLGDKPPSGYTTIILFLSFSFAGLFIIISILSFYFEKLIEEVKKKPIFLIKEIIE